MDLKFSIAVCDDEEYYREYLKIMMGEYLTKKGILFDIDTYNDGMELCRKESNLHKYDAIFLDIDMPDKNGMETAYEIRMQNSEVDIVFITVMQQYVFEGYKVGAVRYIMKKDMAELIPECLDALLKKYSRYGICLSNGMQIPVSRSRSAEVKKVI